MPMPSTVQLVPAPATPMHPASRPRNSGSDSDDTDTTCSVVFDLGTTCSRACLVGDGAPKFISFPPTLRDPEQFDDTTQSKATASFFDTHTSPYECIVSSDGNADQIPLQFFPEIRHLIELRAAIGMNKYETTVRSRFPLFENFFARYDELPVEGRHAVMCHAENTYLTFLEQVHDAAERTADMLRCEITQILATFPSSWTSWVQKYHAVCLQMTWKLPLSSIELMYECEAIANSVLTRSATRYMDNPSPKKMLVVDLGAHVLSISGFCVELGSTDLSKFHLFKNGDISSAHSGVHLHAALVKARIRSYIESNRDTISKSNEEAFGKRLFASYLHKCSAMVKGQAFVICADLSSGEHHQILFSDENSRQMCDRCFSDAFNTLDKMLHDAAHDNEPRETEVVLTGGGFRNTSIREEVEKRVKDRGLVLHDSTHSDFDATESTNVALGAAYTVLQAITADEYMQMACFALWNTKNTGSPHSVIWSNGSSRTARFTASESERDESFIVCYPAPRVTNMASIDETPKYKFSKLPNLPRGDYALHLEYETSSNSDDRVIAVHIHAGGGGKVEVVRYPVYYDRASRLCFRDIDTDRHLDTEHQINADFEEPEPLQFETPEELKAKILARTSYRPPKRQAFLSALNAFTVNNNRKHNDFAPARASSAGKGKRRADPDSGATA